MQQAVYFPDIFVQPELEQARRIILTPEAGLSTDERWQMETDWLMQHLLLPDGIIVDYGCGVGRVAQRLVNPVIGVDASATMRMLASQQLVDRHFITMSPFMLQQAVAAGLRVAGIITIWTLQHVLELTDAVQLMYNALQPGGVLWSLDRDERMIPALVDEGFYWVGQPDEPSVADMLIATFGPPVSAYDMPEELCRPGATLRQFARSAASV